MLLLLASLEDFKFILQIVLWIAIPAILIATGIVYFLHYRKQKKETAFRLRRLESRNTDLVQSVINNEEMHQLPDIGYEGEQLIKKYRKEIKNTSEKYDLLKREFGRLEEKYMELMANRNSERLLISNSTSSQQVAEYESKIAQLQQALENSNNASANNIDWESIVKEKEEQLNLKEAELNELEQELRHYADQSQKLSTELAAIRNEPDNGIAQDAEEFQQLLQQQLLETERTYKKEITGLLLQIEKANSEIQHLKATQQESFHNTKLAEASAHQEGSEPTDNLQLQLRQLENEKTSLRNQLTEEKYLQDLLQEKNAHINFLQAQLEQRLKNYRQLEQQHIVDSETIKAMDDMVKKQERELAQLKEVLKEKDKEIIEKQGILESANFKSEEQQKKMQAKLAEIEDLKKLEKDALHNNAVMEATLINNNKTIGGLNKQLFEQNEKIDELEKKLDVSSQLLIKIYKELARSFGTTIINNIGQEKISDRDVNSLLSKPSGETPLLAVNE
jgi:chromosome segregation ATPase